MIKAEKTALLLIEFQNDFCTENGKLHSLVKEEIARNRTIENAARLLKGAREKGVRVIHIPFVLDRAWASKRRFEGLISGLLDGDIFAPNSWGGAIIDELTPVDGETILSGKRALNAFVHTDLASILQEMKIENVGVAGFLTNVCAQATAWGAYDLGYRTRLIPSACGAASEYVQKFVENEICPIFGGVPSVDDFLNELQ